MEETHNFQRAAAKYILHTDWIFNDRPDSRTLEITFLKMKL